MVGPSNIWSLQNFPLKSDYHLCDKIFEVSLQEETLLCSITFLGQAYIDFIHARSGLAPPMPYLAQKLQLKAIRALEYRLSSTSVDRVTDDLLTSIALLVVGSLLCLDWVSEP